VSADEGILLIRDFTSVRDYTYPNDLVLITNLTASILDKLKGKASKDFGQVRTLNFNWVLIFLIDSNLDQ